MPLRRDNPTSVQPLGRHNTDNTEYFRDLAIFLFRSVGWRGKTARRPRLTQLRVESPAEERPATPGCRGSPELRGELLRSLFDSADTSFYQLRFLWELLYWLPRRDRIHRNSFLALNMLSAFVRFFLSTVPAATPRGVGDSRAARALPRRPFFP